jgi:hypothetical protein
MSLFSRQKSVNVRPVSIVGDGAIAMHGVGEGKMFPVVILDTSDWPEIVEYMRIHQFSGPGDVLTTWGKLATRKNTVILILKFQRPMEISFAIAFELHKAHSILVEGVLQSGGLYIQAGVEGDRVRNTLHQPRVIIEVPDTGFALRWEQICLAYLATKARAEGFNRKTAKRLAVEQYAMLKQLAAARPFPS